MYLLREVNPYFLWWYRAPPPPPFELPHPSLQKQVVLFLPDFKKLELYLYQPNTSRVVFDNVTDTEPCHQHVLTFHLSAA